MQKIYIPSTLVRCRHTGFSDSLADGVRISRSFHVSSHRPAEQALKDSNSKVSSATGRGQKRLTLNELSQDANPLVRTIISRRPAERKASATPKPAPSRSVDVRSLAAAPPDVQQQLVRKVNIRSGTLDRVRGVSDRGSRTHESRSKWPQAQKRNTADPQRTGNISSKFATRKPAPRKKGPRKNDANQGSSNFEGISTSAALEGLKSKPDIVRAMAATKLAKSTTYKFSELTSESLLGNSPAMPLAEWGMTTLVEQWVDRIAKAGDRKREMIEQMAETVKNGNLVPFGDRETKEKVLDAAENGIAEMSEEDRTAAAQRLREAFGKDFSERVLKGAYVFNGRENADVPELLAWQMTRNASFPPKSKESLVEKVTAMLPPASPGGSQDVARV